MPYLVMPDLVNQREWNEIKEEIALIEKTFNASFDKEDFYFLFLRSQGKYHEIYSKEGSELY